MLELAQNKKVLVSVCAAICLMLTISLSPHSLAQDLDQGVKAYNTGNYQTAIKHFKPLALQGDLKAQFNMGIIYKNGKGVTQDYAEAVKWFRLAAKQGSPEAQN